MKKEYKMEDWIVIQGDSTDLKKITVTGVTDYTDYEGKLIVFEKCNLNVKPISVPIIAPDIAKGFTIGLTPGQTESLEVGDYRVGFEMKKTENSVITFRRELTWEMGVKTQLIP